MSRVTTSKLKGITATLDQVTIPAGHIEYLEKAPAHTVFASAAGLRGAKVGFTA